MGLFRRGGGASARTPKAPADLRQRLSIPGSEKVLAWGSGPMPGGDRAAAEVGYLAATDRAFYVEGAGDRIGWDRISRASWEEPVLDVVLEDENGRAAGRMRLRVDVSGDLPAAVHDRVTASVVVSEVIDLGDGAKARMVARRPSDDGEVRWSVVFDAGVDPSDPQLQARAREALADLRSAMGI